MTLFHKAQQAMGCRAGIAGEKAEMAGERRGGWEV
jgi:hypothetical protein